MENRSYFRIRKCSEKEAVFRNVLEKAVRKEKNESLFQTRSKQIKYGITQTDSCDTVIFFLISSALIITTCKDNNVTHRMIPVIFLKTTAPSDPPLQFSQ